MPPVDLPRGNAGPKPAPTPVANTRTGNNPRGVAIAVTPKGQATTPAIWGRPHGSGVFTHPGPAFVQPASAYANPKSAPKLNLAHIGSNIGGHAPQSFGSLEASIHPGTSMASLLAPAPGILGRLGSQVVSLPKDTIVGLTQLPGLVEHPSRIGQVIKSDPIYQAVTKGSLTPLAHDPLGTLLDASMVYGAAGRLAGATARAGALGKDAKAAASLARTPRYIPMMGESSNVATHALENAVGKTTRSYSPNLFTQLIQKHADARVPTALDAARTERAIVKGVATDHAAEQGVRAADAKTVIKNAKKFKPAGKEEQNVARFIIPYGTAGSGDVKTALQTFRHNIANAQAEDLGKYGITVPQRDAILGHLDAAIAKPNLDVPSLLKATEGYGRVQQALEEKLAKLDTFTQEHMDNATRAAYMQQVPGVHYLDRPVSDPRLFSAVKAAKAVVAQREKDLQAAIAQKAADAQTHARVGSFISSTLKRTPTHYTTDNLVNSLLDSQKLVQDSRPVVNAGNKAAVKAAKDALTGAKADLTSVTRAFRTRKLQGTVIEDSGVPAMRGGPLKGLGVRPIHEGDYQAALAREPGGFQPSHLTARNLLRDRIEELRSAAANNVPHLAESGRAAVSGEAAKVGDLNPGWGGVVRSQLNTVNALSVERELQNFMGRWADPRVYDKLKEAQAAANDAKAASGVTMTTIHWKGGFRNVPQAALNELERQFKADHPSRKWQILTKPNRLFRNTVLAMSTKLPIMHSVENASRTALHEGPLAPIRTGVDLVRGVKMMHGADQISPDLGAGLRQILTPGSLSHSGEGALGEDAGKLAIEQQPVRAAAQRAAHLFNAVPHTIIRFQRMLEQPAQYIALGAHGRQMLQEMGHSWLEANTSVSKYTNDLARGLADPAEAQRAAEFMHKTLGQYNALTGRTRLALRFMPFGSWYANAARLVLVTLPKDHPLFSALVHDLNQGVAQQWNAQHAGLPEDMQASLNVGPNAWLDVGKFLPIGVQNPDLSGVESTAQQLFMPEFSQPALNLMGKGPFLSDLYGPNTPYGKNEPPFKSAANMAAIESILSEFGGPTNHIARMLFGHGGTMYNTDTPILHLAGIGSVAEKPGSQTQQKGPLLHILGPALDRELDPLRPTTFGSSGGGGSSRAFGSSTRAGVGTTNSRAFGSNVRQ